MPLLSEYLQVIRGKIELKPLRETVNAIETGKFDPSLKLAGVSSSLHFSRICARCGALTLAEATVN